MHFSKILMLMAHFFFRFLTHLYHKSIHISASSIKAVVGMSTSSKNGTISKLNLSWVSTPLFEIPASFTFHSKLRWTRKLNVNIYGGRGGGGVVGLVPRKTFDDTNPAAIKSVYFRPHTGTLHDNYTKYLFFKRIQDSNCLGKKLFIHFVNILRFNY